MRPARWATRQSDAATMSALPPKAEIHEMTCPKRKTASRRSLRQSETLVFFARRKRCARWPIIDDLMSFSSVTSPSVWAMAGVSNELDDVCTGLPFPVMTQR